MTLVMRSSVANTTVSIELEGGSPGYHLALLATIPNANAWTAIQLPNIAAWTSAASWSTAPGTTGYWLGLQWAGGSGTLVPANGIWGTTGYIAQGLGNFAANPVGSTLDFAFIQHEPGGTPTGILDKGWAINELECLRYYCKSYDYGVPVGSTSVNWSGEVFLYGATPYGFGIVPFPVPMAQRPTVTTYISGGTGIGTANQVQEYPSATNRAVSSTQTTTKGISFINCGTVTANSWLRFQYQADTGW
jgi:hypothetical protein